MDYRNLTNSEIDILKNQGCWAENWKHILVTANFQPANIQNVRFSGNVKLGLFSKQLEIEPGISKSTGLYNSYIQNCTIGDEVYIAEVKNLVNYQIDNQVAIENVGTLVVNGETTFGNGTEIEILNEGGGRELPIFDRLSAQIAYLLVVFQHDQKLIKKLRQLIADYAATRKSNIGRICQRARITNCNVIRNVYIGKNARIASALHLEEGTIASAEADPTVVGEGVVAKDFIILSGSKVDGSAMLADCFVGQGVRIGKQYSAENSGFFANSEGFHGEACSIFAGPYTVTHHKSTLLIAGLFSFYNAGSGTNQSNHMYKLGPLHQGILDRGSKTGSFSYLLWPCRIGAFTAVIGKHYSNFDTSDLPFSYINEVEGKSILTPAMNLFTVGTRRDSVKWPNRDRRQDPEKFDLINFEFFNPYIIGKVLRGIEQLKNLYENASRKQEFITYNGIQIKRLMLRTAIKYYEIAVKIYIGNEVLKRLDQLDDLSALNPIIAKLQPTGKEGLGNWVDLAGMFLPADELGKLLKQVQAGEISRIENLIEKLEILHSRYDEFAWNWSADLIQKRLKINLKEITSEQLVQLVTDWQKNALKLNNMISKDAGKEFDPSSKIGFGVDGNAEVQDRDFNAVRGTYDQNKFVLELQAESEAIQTNADELIGLLQKL